MRRLGVIGTLVWDRIRHPSTGDRPVEQWGGITYSLAALSAVADPAWSAVPILKIGADMHGEATSLLEALDDLELGGALLPVPEPTNRVELVYSSAEQRGERLTGGVESWSWSDLEPRIAGLDAIYLNFISGFELELETARTLRERFSGFIYADLHSLFLGCPGGGVRAQRVPPRWEEWLPLFDAVQLNEAELSLLADAGGSTGSPADLLERGPSLVAVTRGAAGASIEARPSAASFASLAEPLSLEVPVPGGPLTGDPTGCGDIWGATFIAGLLGGLPIRDAAERAHRLARAKIAHPSTATLAQHLRRAAAHPGDDPGVSPTPVSRGSDSSQPRSGSR